jgi:hypothetical protein
MTLDPRSIKSDLESKIRDPGSKNSDPGSTSRTATLETRTHLGDGLDLGAELLLDPVQGESIVVGDQVDRHTQVSEPAPK